MPGAGVGAGAGGPTKARSFAFGTSATTSSYKPNTSLFSSDSSHSSLLVTTAKKTSTGVENASVLVRPSPKQPKDAVQYNFSSEEAQGREKPKFIPPEFDPMVQPPRPSLFDVVGVKVTLTNSVATSLLCSPDFKNRRDPTFRSLQKLGGELARYDPEFLLKLALYTRRNLNIRTTANFLLGLAAVLNAPRPFLKKYFCAAVQLPSDWIEIAEIYVAFHDKSIASGSLPTALRKAMAAKFPEFDAYQLAKYNKDTSKKKKAMKKKRGASDKNDKSSNDKKKSISSDDAAKKKPPAPAPAPSSSSEDSDSDSEGSVVEDETSETEEELERQTFTLKQLIRKMHISEPAEHVMCLVGKKYPEDPEAFRRTRLSGIWDQDRAGKRMKLPTPLTWETEVSTRGNKSATWEKLIDQSKLPFMAMLRNLRNLIYAGISQKHHQWVLKRLQDERAVVNSKQFPFRFFSAYEVLREIEKVMKGEVKEEQRPPQGKGKRKKKPKPVKELPKSATEQLLKQYRNALDTALKIATCYNVKPIGGSTLILCNVGSNMRHPCTTARGLGKPRTVQEVGILLGLMCKYSCEQCSTYVYGHEKFAEVSLKEGTILHNMETVLADAARLVPGEQKGAVPTALLASMLVERKSIDNLVLLTDAMNLESEEGRNVMDFLKKYRHLVNPNLLFVSVDLSSKSTGVSGTITPTHKNNIHLAGYSDQILRFIAERGDTGQLTYIENIDKAFNLKEVKVSALLSTEQASSAIPSLVPEKTFLATTSHWRTIRVFISSTFRDMHGERDLLTRFVFPELRARAHALHIQLYEVDLRWGVTEEESRSHRALSICLNEISKCQYFVGLLGQRYGWIQDEYHCPDSPEYDWLKGYPSGRSITEVEMYHAALCDPDKANGKAFFFFRNKSLLEEVPAEYREDFSSESPATAEKMERLKSEIRTSGLEVYDNYPAKWLGEAEGRAMVGGLEDFGLRVLHNLWNAIQKDFPEGEQGDAISQATAAHNSFLETHSSSFVGRKALLKSAMDLVQEESDGALVAASGKSGSGKTAFMATLAQMCMDSTQTKFYVLPHFVSAVPDSTDIVSVLTRFCHEMKRRFGVDLEVPEGYSDLAHTWVEFAEKSVANAGQNAKLVMVIDGIDLLEDKHNARAMEWLPEEIPKGVVIVLSAVEGGSCLAALQRRKVPPKVVVVGAMDISDKAEMVRHQLSKHRKTLDESPFNNQMKVLLTKKDANNPLYLHLACEELRVFGMFEQVMTFLRKLPSLLPALLQEVLTRMEGELGAEVLSTSLVLLCLARNGLLECELTSSLTSFFSKEGSEVMLPPMAIARLLRSLQLFLQPTNQNNSDLLTIAHRDIKKAIRHSYMKGVASDKERVFHALLAGYFKSQVDPSGEGLYDGTDERAFCELPYHLMAAGAWKELEETVCNLNFVISKCRLGLAHHFLEDCSPSTSDLPPGRARDVSRFIQLNSVQDMKSFVSRNLHILITSPALSLQQAVNEPSSSAIAKRATEMVKKSPVPLFKWLNNPNEVSSCQMTILSSTTGLVLSVALSQDDGLFATGSKDCVVKVFELSTGKEVHTFIGHAAGITSLCFVGKRRALCSASLDGTLSLWDLQEGHRITTMKGHTKSVHGCAADPSGKVIASVSWDKSIQVWNGLDGKRIATLKVRDSSTPLNCVAFHPEGQRIVVGSWDAKLTTWDTLAQKRLKTMKGHKTSVQACAYAPSGRHIVSSALDGEVKVWSTYTGSAVGSITGHYSPVHSLAFTPTGQYLVTASSDKLVKVWSGTLGKLGASIGPTEFGYATSVALCQSRHRVIVGYHDGHVQIVNLQSDSQSTILKIHNSPVLAVAFVNATQMMSASVDGSIKVWTVKSAANQEYIELPKHTAMLTCVVWQSKGFASASEDMVIHVWPHKDPAYKKKTKDGVKPLATLRGHTAKISCLAFASDGYRLVSGSHDCSLIIWDLLSYKQMKVLNACHKDWISCLDISMDYLITGSNDFTLKIWNLRTDTEKTTLTGHTSAVSSVAFSQGCIVSGAVDGSVKVWTQKGVEITTLHCHKLRVNACLLDVKKKASTQWADIVEEEEEEGGSSKIRLQDVSVITASDDGTVGVWKPFVPNEVATLVGHSDRVVSVAATGDNKVLSSSLDGTVKLWAPPSLLTAPSPGLKKKSTVAAHTGPVTSASFSENGRYFVSSGRDGHLIVWDTKEGGGKEDDEGGLEKKYVINVSDETAIGAVFFVKNVSIAVGTDKGFVHVYKFSPEECPTLVKAVDMQMDRQPITKIVLSGDNNCLLVGSWSKQVAGMDRQRNVVFHMKSHSDWVVDISSTDKDASFSLGLDNELCQWKHTHVPKLHEVQAVGKYKPSTQKDGLLQVMCDVGSGYLALGDSNGYVFLWNKATRRTTLTRKLHGRGVVAMTTIGEDDCLLVTGSSDATVKVWRVVCDYSPSLEQLGLYYCQSCVTTLASCYRPLAEDGNITDDDDDSESERDGKILIVAGDSLGHITLLQWSEAV